MRYLKTTRQKALKSSNGSSGRVGEPRNMKSMRPPSPAIFFMTYLTGPGDDPLGLPRSATEKLVMDYITVVLVRS